MASLSETLIERAEAVRRQIDELLLALERTRRGVTAVLEASEDRGPPA